MARSSRSSSKKGKRLFLLVLLGAGIWWYWTHWRPTRDYRVLSGHLENSVNQELARRGVRDTQIVSQVRKDHQRWDAQWVETTRRIELPSTKAFPVLLEQLEALAGREHCRTVRYQDSPTQITLEIRKGLQTLQRLVFAEVSLAPKPLDTPQAALVIDDVAYDFPPMDRYAALHIPLTFAILPRDKNTRALAQKAKAMGFGVILHLPMEPIDLAHNNPGSAALYLAMTPEQLHQQFEKDVASVPAIQGINNHMGSAFTSDEAKMTLVLKWVKEKNFFFLNSHTAPHSVVPKVARRVGVPCLVNETFLDNEDSVAGIEHQLDLVLHLAKKNKRTIAIGHYRRKHLAEALAIKIPEFRAQGVTLVTLPTFYEHPRN